MTDRQEPTRVASPHGPHVASQELGDPGPGQLGVVRSVKEWARVGAEAKVRLAAFEVVGDELGGWAHHGHVSDLGPLPADHHRHRVRAADVGDVEVAELLRRAALS